MRLRLLAMSLFIFAVAYTTCTSPPLPDSNEVIDLNLPMSSPWLVEETDAGLVHEEIDIEPVEKEITKKDMVKDIVAIWTMFLDDANCSQGDPRRELFELYAAELADAIIMYQNQPTDIGGQLPKHRSTHAILAVMVTKESSIYSDVVGKSHGEVGLLQLHGIALAGYEPDVVQHNSKLGLLLGVRWFAYQTSICPMYRMDGDKEPWRLEDWAKPLSVYAGGPNAINRKTGECHTFGIARERVDLTRLYISRINAATIS